MNARWYIAKYMTDLRRREPRNVGILLFTGDAVETRFRGDTGDKVDGRLVRGTFGSLDNYKAWIAYWKATAAKNDIAGLLKRRVGENYFVELGGERIVGSEFVEPASFADQLFRELVDDRPDPSLEMAEHLPVARRAFTSLRIVDNIKDASPLVSEIGGVRDLLYFTYRYSNGISALMKEIHLGRDAGVVTQEKLHSAAWTFEQAQKLEQNSRMIALVDWAEGTDPTEPMAYLRAANAAVVSVSSDEEATTGLKAALSLDQKS